MHVVRGTIGQQYVLAVSLALGKTSHLGKTMHKIMQWLNTALSVVGYRSDGLYIFVCLLAMYKAFLVCKYNHCHVAVSCL